MTDTDSLLTTARQGFDTIHVSDELKERAASNLRQWLTRKVFDDARPQLEHLIRSSGFNQLFDAFFQQIPFGTGGRRGPVGFGPNRINEFTIATSIQGHCEFLRRHIQEDELAVVIAYDVRCFRDLRGVYDPERANPLLGTTSRDFARVAACVYAANGVKVWFPAPDRETYVSTPELSFAIRDRGAQGGLNVSASHNHPDDNGAKIYNAKGSQEIPPLDEEMAKIVETIEEARTMDWDRAVEEGRIVWLPDEVHREYVATNRAVSIDPAARSAKVVFTPLHGTGWSSVGSTLAESGFEVECFRDQAAPDGTFPNVPFRSPNPEVRESLEAATEHARQTGADLVLGADPDADRLGMVVPDARRGWTFLNGNQVGIVLAAFLCEAEAERQRRKAPFAVTTVVTTSLFRTIAEAHGFRVISDLGIGFKYIADILNNVEDHGRSGDLEASLEDFVLGIEESHGYLVTPAVRDKDAAGAGLLLCELASRLKDSGRSVLDYLDDVYRKFGYVANHLVSTVMQGARGFVNIRHIQDSLRKSPPETVGERRLVEFVDRWDESGPLGKIVSGTDRASRDLLMFGLEGGARIVLRPSGTESKNKIYVEVASEPLGEGCSAEDLAAQIEAVNARAKEIALEFSAVMLDRIGVTIPRWALEVSDLVPLEWKQDFAATFMPELRGRIESGEAGADLDSWIDDHLRSYGADGRLLVRRAVDAYCRDEAPPTEISSRLRDLFDPR